MLLSNAPIIVLESSKISPFSATRAALGAALLSVLPISEAGCKPFGLETNQSMAGEPIRVCFQKRDDGGYLAYQRYRGAECNDPAEEFGLYGALGVGKLGAPYAWDMPEERARKFITIDPPGQGDSSPLPSYITQKEKNPILMAHHEANLINEKLQGFENPVLHCHSAAGLKCILALDDLPKNTIVYAINTPLEAKREAILNPAKTFPIACGLGEIATSITRRGFAIAYDWENGETRGPGILGLAGRENRKIASETNYALNEFVDPAFNHIPNHVSDDPDKNAVVPSLALSLKDNCSDARAFANAIRVRRLIELWRPKYLEAFATHQHQIIAVNSRGDAVVDATSTGRFLEENDLNIVYDYLDVGGHEVFVTHPTVVLQKLDELKTQMKKTQTPKSPPQPLRIPSGKTKTDKHFFALDPMVNG